MPPLNPAVPVPGSCGGLPDSPGRRLVAADFQHVSACQAHAYAVLRDRHLAQDAVQEAFLDAWRQSGRFDPELSSRRSWLVMLSRRRAVDRLRHENTRPRPVAVEDCREEADERPGPEVLALQAERACALLRALAALARPQREALVLAYWGGYSQSQIAAMTGTPLGTVKARTRDALRRLADDLHDHA